LECNAIRHAVGTQRLVCVSLPWRESQHFLYVKVSDKVTVGSRGWRSIPVLPLLRHAGGVPP
jgi:hypothetical protein